MMEILLLILAVVLIILSLLQGGKSDGFSGAFTGGDSLNLFTNVKERGPDKFLVNATFVVGFTFFILVIMSSIK